VSKYGQTEAVLRDEKYLIEALPQRQTIILQERSLPRIHFGTRLGQGLAVIPWHPGRRMLRHLVGVFLQLGEVVERIGVVQFAGVDQAHEQMAQILRPIHESDPETAIPNLETLEQARGDTLASPRLLANLLGLFAVLTLVIADTGIGDILALSVNQRIHEIGIRLAVGARPVGILLMVIGQSMALVVADLRSPSYRHCAHRCFKWCPLIP
jgi:hypothetical protein